LLACLLLLLLLLYDRTTMMDCRYAGNEYLLRPAATAVDDIR